MLLTLIAAMIQSSGNPIFPGHYADPELHHFNNRFFIYPTTSDKYENQTSFRAFSSPDLTNWRDEGVILDFAQIPWSTNRAAWAPSVAYKNSTFYFYFSAGDGAGLGVATSKSPTGPFQDALGKPLIKEVINGAQPIDAHCFIDDDNQAYLYYGGWRHCNVVRLKPNMIETQGEFIEITPENYVEGPFMLKRNGKYYLMWSEGSWGDHSYGVAYAIADSPLGPFKRKAKILQSDPTIATSTGHHSVLKLPGTERFIIAYHRRPLGVTERDHRVTCLEELIFVPSGEIRPVKITHTGVAPFQPQSQDQVPPNLK
jgi:beta-xylosidase